MRPNAKALITVSVDPQLNVVKELKYSILIDARSKKDLIRGTHPLVSGLPETNEKRLLSTTHMSSTAMSFRI